MMRLLGMTRWPRSTATHRGDRPVSRPIALRPPRAEIDREQTRRRHVLVDQALFKEPPDR
jgi:hypothetical protein